MKEKLIDEGQNRGIMSVYETLLPPFFQTKAQKTYLNREKSYSRAIIINSIQ